MSPAARTTGASTDGDEAGLGFGLTDGDGSDEGLVEGEAVAVHAAISTAGSARMISVAGRTPPLAVIMPMDGERRGKLRGGSAGGSELLGEEPELSSAVTPLPGD
jgi:hypothetical protein